MSFVRIFRTAKVDHLSYDRDPMYPEVDYAPICGQQAAGGWRREFSEQLYPGTHICYRCTALAEEMRS